MGASLRFADPTETSKKGVNTPIRRLYVADFDCKRGVPVDSRFMTAVCRLESAFFRYRSVEWSDTAEIASVAEEAVYKANWALHGRPCESPEGYILRIFRRDADKLLKRRSKILSIDERQHGYANIVGRTAKDVERNVLVRELLDNMNELTRVILLRRIQGDRAAEIGRAFGLSANAVSVRLSRVVARLRHGQLRAHHER